MLLGWYDCIAPKTNSNRCKASFSGKFCVSFRECFAKMSQDFLKVPKKMLSQLNLNSITNILDGVLKYYAEENLMATKKSLDETVIRALVGETENLKKLGVMNVLQPEKLVRIINILMHHVNGSIASRNVSDFYLQ